MTETEPGSARPNAGTVGVHRQDVSEPVTENESLNAVRQSRPGPEPTATARDTGTARTAGGRTETERDRDKGHDEIAEVRQEIERTRDHLGDTIEALAAKADVKARAQERMHATAEAARARAAGVAGRVREMAPQPVRGAAGKVGAQARSRPGLVAAAGAAGTALLLLRRMTRSRHAGTGRMTKPGWGAMSFKKPGLGAMSMKKPGMGAMSLKKGMSGMFQKPGISGKPGMPSGSRLFGKARMGRGPGLFGTSGKLGKPGMLGRRGMFGGRAMSAKGIFGKGMSGKGMFGKGMSGKGMSGKGMFGGSHMFSGTRHRFTRRFAHR